MVRELHTLDVTYVAVIIENHFLVGFNIEIYINNLWLTNVLILNPG